MVSVVLFMLYIVGLLIAFGRKRPTTRNVGVGARCGVALVLVLFVMVLIALSVSSFVFTIMGAVQAGSGVRRCPVASGS